MKKSLILFLLLLPFCMISQNITSINPTQAMQNQTISLIISGNNMSFSGWSCWSNTGNLSDFRFSQWSGTNMLYGTPTNNIGQQLEGDLSVPPNQQIGIYNLEVFDCTASWWIQLPNSFEITTPQTSWDCINNACIDPGNGNGTYSSLGDCNTACGVTPSWDCVNGNCIDPNTSNGQYLTINLCNTACSVTPSWDCFPNSNSQIWDCIDPGTGNGEYTDLSWCDAACSSNSIKEKKSDFLIYPNPTKNTLNVIGEYTSVTIYDVFGKAVLTTYLNQKTINIAALKNGIYFVHINKNDLISITKITITN